MVRRRAGAAILCCEPGTKFKRSQAGGGVASSRASAKASPAYSNRNRDLIDSYAEGQERDEKGQGWRVARGSSQSSGERSRELRSTNGVAKGRNPETDYVFPRSRDAYLAKERNRVAGKVEGSTFGDAAVAAIGKQLEKSGFDRKQDAQSVK